MTKARAKLNRRGRPKKAGPREKSGKLQRPSVAERAEDAQKTAISARLKLLGTPDSPEARKAALSPLAGAPVGLCIMALHPSAKRQADLWQTWQAISAAKRNWQQRITSTNPNPQAAAIAMLPDAMQTDDSHSIDIRTAEDRDRGAVRAWNYWLARLMELPPAERHALRGELDGYAPPLWCADRHQPTREGRHAVNGLMKLCRDP